MKEKIMIKFLKSLLGIESPATVATPAPLANTVPYKVPEPAATTPIPLVPETKVGHDMGGSYKVESAPIVESTPKPKAVTKPKGPAKPKAAKPAAAKAPAKPKAPATKKPKISIAK